MRPPRSISGACPDTRRNKRKGERGLSIIEVLVVVAIIGVTLIPILQFQTQIARTTARYAEVEARASLQRNALVVLRDLNFMERPVGQVMLAEGQTLSWRSTPLTEEAQSTAHPIGDGDFRVILYRVDAEVGDARSSARVSFSIERLGWRRSGVSAAALARPSATP